MKNSKSLRVRATAIVLSAICAVSCLSAVSVSADCSEENDNVQIIDQFRDLTFLNRNNDFEVIKSVSGVNASGDNCRCVKNWTDDDSTGEVEGSASFDAQKQEYTFVVKGTKAGDTFIRFDYVENSSTEDWRTIILHVSVNENGKVSIRGFERGCL